MVNKESGSVLDSVAIGHKAFSELGIRDFLQGEKWEYQVIWIEGDSLVLKVEGNGRFSGTHRDGIIDIRKSKKKRKK